MKEKLAFLFENWKTIPNLLSFIRILLIPVFAVLFYKDMIIESFIVLGISGLSDLFDGKIARKFNQISNLGKILDPVADKLTIFTIAIILFLKFLGSENEMLNAFAWVFLLFIAKDLIMIIGGAFMLSAGMRPGASELPGKLATVAFYAVMLLIMAIGPEVGAFREYYTLPDSVMMALVVIAVVLTFVAFASYMPETYRQFARRFGWGKYKENENKK